MKIRIIAGFALLLMTTLYATGQQKTPFQGKVGKTLAGSEEWWPDPVTPPAHAPNVVWILLDDVGYGASSSFGGLIQTPTFDSLANNGLRYTNFHTAAICAPTRAALLTGRNSHYVGVGGFSHVAMSAGFPGWSGRIPNDKGTIAQILQSGGYNTFAVGKYGLTPDEEATDAGPFDRWPGGKGFEQFFGFLGSQTDQYEPDLVENNAHIKTDGRHLNDQITDKAIGYIQKQQQAAPGKPFFLYYAPGAVHAPHQVAPEYSNRYKGVFDEGWDRYREKVLANQVRLGVVPKNAQLPERNSDVPAWDQLPAEKKKLYARFMETYAGYLTYTDACVGRLISYLKQANLLDNTVVVVMIGDNGASKEGTFQGTLQPRNLIGKQTEEEQFRYNLSRIDDIGLPQGKNTNYPLGWAQATNTPFRQWKQDANAEGGTHNPLIIFYPRGIKEQGGIRTQYSHVIDILPTTLDLVGIKAPEVIRNVPQDTIQGYSLFKTLNDAGATATHRVQHYYIFGARSIYANGWKAATAHHPDAIDYVKTRGSGWKGDPDRWEKDVWELYNLDEDFNERVNLAKKYPEKLEALKKLFDQQAEKNNLYPLIDWEDVYEKRIHKNYKPAVYGATAPAAGK
ncbi:arylsulfatase [Niabella sp.]|uniref:arylsulfatase n=1 Tax=Niabella sp. TaxID=1962976 RepID=UPI00260E76CC|nr:arylsulfatase [Niabella sp.]